MSAATPAQQSVLDYVQSFHLANGVPPTRHEIARHFGWSSPNAAHQHLKLLEQKGIIRLIRGQARGIRVIPATTETLKLPERTPIQLKAIEVRKIWDSEGCHSETFPVALTELLEMIERNNQ